MKLTTKVLLRSSLTCSLLILKFLLSPTSYAAERVLWRETFEGQANLWDPDRGGWQFGAPSNTSGPQAIQGQRCAAIGLRANHPNGLNTSFIRNEYFTVPPAEQHPRLRFNHWFSTYGGDFGQVRVRELGGDPQTISETFTGVSSWSEASLPLSQFSGKQIRVEFYFESNSDNFNSAGWFIDDVALAVGSTEFSGFESFEGPALWSFRNWHSTRGNWEIGTPTHGPGRAYRGTNCAAISLSKAHPNLVDSTLFSPYFTVPGLDQKPQLRFHHWFSTYGGDFGQVQIREEGAEPVVISETFDGVSDWSRATLPLTNFAGKRVRIEFRFQSNGDNFNSAGWFIDDVHIYTGDYQFRGFEGFETGASDWAPTRGNWDIGKPTFGPGAAFTGTNCAALRLSSAHPNLVKSSLLSPPFTVPPADRNPRLRFQHWYSTYGGDYGEVRIRDESGAVQTVSEQFTGISDWTRTTIALANFVGKNVRIEFFFESNGDNFNSAGWFIDDVELLASPQENSPVLQPIPTQIGPPSGTISFSAVGSDSDPGQSLTYSLDPSTAPEGASIQPQTGAFTWDPTPAQRRTNAYIRIRVSDSATPARSTSQLVSVAMPGGIRIQPSHVWEPFNLQVLGAVPGLDYSSYAVTNIHGNTLFPESTPVYLTNLVITGRGEAGYLSDPGLEKMKVFMIKGQLPSEPQAQ